MSEQNQAADGAEQSSARKGPTSNGVSFLTCCLVALGFSAFSSLLAWQVTMRRVDAAVAPQLVVVDSQRIISARLAQLIKSNATPEKAGQEGTAMASQLAKEIRRYREQGFVVLNKSSVLDAPGELDVTSDVAKAVGVALQ
jgi:hypothetical protein